MEALSAASHEATAAADREHVMPFLYGHPERFRIGTLPRTAPAPPAGERWRYTVDTPEDLELARALAERFGHGPPVRLDELEIDHGGRARPWRGSTRPSSRSRGTMAQAAEGR